MTWPSILIPILVSTLSGWLLVLLIGKLIFYPRKALKIGGFILQGFLPANQASLGEKLGSAASSAFDPANLIEQKVADPENYERLKPEIEHHIDIFLREKLKITFPMLAAFIGEKTISQLKAAFLMELEILFPVLMKSFMGQLQQDINIEKLVAEKLGSFPADRLEQLIKGFIRKPFLRMQLLGACFGFLMGWLQVIVGLVIG